MQNQAESRAGWPAMRPERRFRFRGGHWCLGERTLVMGILNVTPDSFSDGGCGDTPEAAVARGLELVRQGADVLDIGGESTRPGAAPVSAEEECRRIVPVIRGLRAQVAVPLSVDTTKAAVAEAAIAAGAQIVNDISAFRRDPAMPALVRSSGAGAILMHMRGTPADMQCHTSYGDLVQEICDYFSETLEICDRAGIAREAIMLDPGVGFSKTAEQNAVLLFALPRFRQLGCALLVGPSRKSFIGKLLPGEPPPPARVWGTAAAVAVCVLAGADLVRVHDVAEMRQVVTVTDGLCRWAVRCEQKVG